MNNSYESFLNQSSLIGIGLDDLLLQLTTIVFGSEGLAKLSTGRSHDEFESLRVRHEVAQASKLLIEIALVLRNLMDSSEWPMEPIHEIRVENRPELSNGVLT